MMGICMLRVVVINPINLTSVRLLVCLIITYTKPTDSPTKSTLSLPIYDAYADYFMNVAGVMYKVNLFVYKSTDPSNAGDWSLVSTMVL